MHKNDNTHMLASVQSEVSFNQHSVLTHFLCIVNTIRKLNAEQLIVSQPSQLWNLMGVPIVLILS